MARQLPHFFVVGSSRSGTTSLWHILRRHPDVFLPDILEPRYFAFSDSTLQFTGPGDELLVSRLITDRQAYERLFVRAGQSQLLGDISPAYLSVEGTAERIYREAPDARIIAILRNPVERAVSSFRLERLDGFEPLEDLSDALAEEDNRQRLGWSYVWRYRQRGYYFRQLAPYLKLFPRSSILILPYESWKNTSYTLVRQITDFLGLRPSPDNPSDKIRHNSTSHARFAERAINRYLPTAKVLDDLAEGYRDDIGKLSDTVGLDVRKWITSNGQSPNL